MEIKVLYHDEKMPVLKTVNGGDWIDLRVSDVKGKHAHPYEDWLYDGLSDRNKSVIIEGEDAFVYCAGDVLMLNLGISMKLPEGFEGHLAPRSSTFKNWGFLQTNSVGVIDNSYCGNKDVWCMPVYCTRAGVISRHSRVCQFRIVEKMKHVDIISVSDLGDKSRGGFGSTGV